MMSPCLHDCTGRPLVQTLSLTIWQLYELYVAHCRCAHTHTIIQMQLVHISAIVPTARRLSINPLIRSIAYVAAAIFTAVRPIVRPRAYLPLACLLVCLYCRGSVCAGYSLSAIFALMYLLTAVICKSV